jgi:hypothetical protein
MTNLAHNLTDTATRYGDPEPAPPPAAVPDVPALPVDRWSVTPWAGFAGSSSSAGRRLPTDPIGEHA